MTITITLPINRRIVFVTCLGLVALLLFMAPWQASASQQASLAVATCPTVQPAAAIPPRITIGVVQRYERGYMMWLGDTRTLYVMYNTSSDAFSGTFETYPEHWEQGMPETDPNLVPPAGMWQPTRGGGLLWRTNQHVRDGLGWGTSDDHNGYEAVVTTIGNKTWMNGPSDAWLLDGNHWQEIYYWRNH
jgi:hypothetical protein